MTYLVTLFSLGFDKRSIYCYILFSSNQLFDCQHSYTWFGRIKLKDLLILLFRRPLKLKNINSHFPLLATESHIVICVSLPRVKCTETVFSPIECTVSFDFVSNDTAVSSMLTNIAGGAPYCSLCWYLFSMFFANDSGTLKRCSKRFWPCFVAIRSDNLCWVRKGYTQWQKTFRSASLNKRLMQSALEMLLPVETVILESRWLLIQS